MAKVFSDSDGNIGTMVVLKGRPEDYLSEEQEYHGELELPSDPDYRAAWKHDNGAIVEDIPKVRDILKAKLEVKCEVLREDLKKKIARADLIADDANRNIEKMHYRNVSTEVDAAEASKIAELDAKRAVNTLKAVNLDLGITLE